MRLRTDRSCMRLRARQPPPLKNPYVLQPCVTAYTAPTHAARVTSSVAVFSACSHAWVRAGGWCALMKHAIGTATVTGQKPAAGDTKQMQLGVDAGRAGASRRAVRAARAVATC